MGLECSPVPTLLKLLVTIRIITYIRTEASLKSVLLDIQMTIAANSTNELSKLSCTIMRKDKTSSKDMTDTDEDDDSSTNT